MSEAHRHTPDAYERVRTPLLTLITRESLDQDYEMVARRRAQRSEPGSVRGGAGRTSGRVAVVAAVAAFGVLVSVAAVQTSRNAEVADASRTELIKRIESRRAAVREDQRRIADLRAENADADDALVQLGEAVNRAQGQALDLRAQTGFTAVTGEGVRIILDNAPYADETTTIRDSDLSVLVDALWSAGAEAISINGQRLTAMTGIRNVSTAIEVNHVGIAAPYTILAIGDRSTLAADLLESGSGLLFSALASQYGFQVDLDNEDELHIPAASSEVGRLRSARTAPEGGNRAEEDVTQ